MPELTDDERNWLINAADRNEAMIAESAIFMQMYSPSMLKDPLALLQLGLAIMLDKPIVVFAATEEEVPENLKAIAHRTIYGDVTDPEVKSQLMALLTETAENA